MTKSNSNELPISVPLSLFIHQKIRLSPSLRRGWWRSFLALQGGYGLDQIRGIIGRQGLSCGRLLSYRVIFLRLPKILQRCGVGDF